jgi:hypothetical protein
MGVRQNTQQLRFRSLQTTLSIASLIRSFRNRAAKGRAAYCTASTAAVCEGMSMAQERRTNFSFLDVAFLNLQS